VHSTPKVCKFHHTATVKDQHIESYKEGRVGGRERGREGREGREGEGREGKEGGKEGRRGRGDELAAEVSQEEETGFPQVAIL